MPNLSGHSSRWLAIAGLILLSTLVYLPSLSGSWLGDDFFLVVNATCNRGLAAIPEILVQDAGRCNYRPLRHISYAIDYEIWGLAPMGYRLTNLGIHVASVLVAFGILRLLDFRELPAFFCAAVFAVHPVQVDAVAYISGRRDVLMGLGYLIALYGGFRATRNGPDDGSPGRELPWVILSIFGVVVAVTSKEMGVTAPALIVLYWLLRTSNPTELSESMSKRVVERLRANWAWLVGLSLPALAMVVWRGFLNPASTVKDSLFGGSILRHIQTIFAVHAKYLEIIFFPVRLAGDYAPPVVEIPNALLDLPSLVGAAWLAILVSVLILAFFRGRWRTSFGIGWYLVSMLPVSHLIPHHEIAAEHYLYIPLLGLVIAAADLAEAFLERADENSVPKTRRTILLLVCTLIVGALSLRAYLRSGDYLNELTHARATVQHYPNSVRGRARLGLALLDREGLEQAQPHLSYVLGTEFMGSARLDVLKQLGLHYVDEGDYGRARRLFEEFRTVRPRDVVVLKGLSRALFELKDIERATELNRMVVVQEPNSPQNRYRLALTLTLQGQVDAARGHLRDALELDPDHFDSVALYASLLVDDNPERAARLLSKARRLLAEHELENEEQKQQLIDRLRKRLETR